MTLEQFNLYKEYHGDLDMFIRVASNLEKILTKHFDWHSFGGLLQDLYIVSQNQASQEYKEQALNKLNEIVSDKGLRNSIMAYAELLKKYQSE